VKRDCQKGFTLVELIIVLVIGVIFLGIISGGACNTRGQTEKRAYDGLNLFLQRNPNIQVERSSCAGDSDGDGYGTCTIVQRSGETIRLECPTGWFDRWSGAQSCKEVTNVIDIRK